MDKFLDAYIKLVTQFLTILAPLTTILLNEFNNRKKSAQDESAQVEKETNEELGNMSSEEQDKIGKASLVLGAYQEKILRLR